MNSRKKKQKQTENEHDKTTQTYNEIKDKMGDDYYRGYSTSDSEDKED